MKEAVRPACHGAAGRLRHGRRGRQPRRLPVTAGRGGSPHPAGARLALVAAAAGLTVIEREQPTRKTRRAKANRMDAHPAVLTALPSRQPSSRQPGIGASR